MIKIVAEKTPFYKYALTFEWSVEKLNYCRQLKDDFGWSVFSFSAGKWRFTRPEIIVKIKEDYRDTELDGTCYVDWQMTLALINKKNKEKDKAVKLEKAIKEDAPIPGIKTKLRDYQKEGVKFFVNNGGRGYLTDEMGSGKTLQSLAYLAFSEKKKSLVICPASVKWSWEGEVRKHTKFKALVVGSNTDPRKLLGKEQIVIINYDILHKFSEALRAIQWDACVMDESQYIKESSSRRTKHAKAIAKRIPSVIFLSGTPVLSRPIEMFTALNILDPMVWNNWYSFAKTYCGGTRTPWGFEAKGATRLDELQEKISKYFLRRTKDQILKDLPEKIFIDYPVKLDKTTQSQYNLAEEEFANYLREIKHKRDKEVQKSMQAETLVKMGELRILTTKGKIKAAEELIENILENDEKMIVFSCYNEPLDFLHEKYKNISVILTGKSSEDEKRYAVDNFQKKDKIKIFFGGIKSAGVGITLTAATNVIFIDYSWVPADHLQAQDRLHRIGNKAKSVNIYQLFAKNTIDENMQKLLEKKKAIVDKLVDGKDTEPKQSVLKDLLKTIEKNYE